MSNPTTVVYTAIFSDYDVLVQPQNVPEHVDFVCFTDDPEIATGRWEPRELTGALPPRDQTARAKMLPHDHFPAYEYSIWVDGKLGIVNDVTDLIDDAESGIVTFEHPQRDCIYKEAEVCIELGLAKQDTVVKQMQRYRDAGFPESYGLSDVAMLVRRHHEPHVRSVMRTWYEEFQRGATRFQLSFEYALWKHGYEPDRLEREIMLQNCGYFRRLGHKPPGVWGRVHEIRVRAFERRDRTPYFLFYALASVPMYAHNAQLVLRNEGPSALARKSLEKVGEWLSIPRR